MNKVIIVGIVSSSRVREVHEVVFILLAVVDMNCPALNNISMWHI